MKKIIIILALISYGFVFAQQDPLVSSYMFNSLFLNPGYAGTHQFYESSLLYRNQWGKFDGAPRTSLFSLDGPMMGDKMGIGLIVSNDKIGVTNETEASLNYAYHLKVKENAQLSLGVKAGITSIRANLDDLVYWDDDQVLNQGVQRVTIPKFGFGAYYYSDKFYAGLSIPSLLAYEKNMGFSFDIDKSSHYTRHYYLNLGYVYTLSDLFKIKPAALLRLEPTSAIQADINLSVMYNDMVWIGGSYRTGDAIVALIEYKTNLRFRVGYAYDHTISSIRNYAGGTHEIFIGYDFGKDFDIAKSFPSFF